MTFLGGPQSDYAYPAFVSRVVDGDTVGAELTLINNDLGFGISAFQTITFKRMRLAGIDSPEPKTQAGANAKVHIESLLGPLPAKCVITTVKDRADGHGRYLAWITLPDGTVVNQQMVTDGFAVALGPHPTAPPS